MWTPTSKAFLGIHPRKLHIFSRMPVCYYIHYKMYALQKLKLTITKILSKKLNGSSNVSFPFSQNSMYPTKENQKISKTVSVLSSFPSNISVGVGGLSDQAAGIPPFIDMFYFEIEFVVWEGCITIFNRCLLSCKVSCQAQRKPRSIKFYPLLLRNYLYLERHGKFKVLKILIRCKS